MANSYRNGSCWYDSEVQELKKFWNEGLPVEWIATYFSRTQSAIESAVAKHLPKELRKRKKVLNISRKWTVNRIEELRGYWINGIHVDDICIKMNASLYSILFAAKRYLGSDYKRNVIPKKPEKRLKKTSLNQWIGPHADEHEAWLRMVQAKDRQERLAAEQAWIKLAVVEHTLLSNNNA